MSHLSKITTKIKNQQILCDLGIEWYSQIIIDSRSIYVLKNNLYVKNM